MVDLETIISLASMTCNCRLDAYELHSLGDEKNFNNFTDEYYAYILSLAFLSLKVYLYCLILPK